MRKIAIADSRRTFINDISTRILLNEDLYDFEVTDLILNPADIDKVIEKNIADEICISEEIALSREWNIIGPKITTFASSMTGVNNILKKGLSCYGVAKKAGELLDYINSTEPKISDMKQSSVHASTLPKVSEKNSSMTDIDDFLFGSDYKNKTDVAENKSVNRKTSDMDKSETYINEKYAKENIPYTQTRNKKSPNIDKELFGDDYREKVSVEEMQKNIEREEKRIQDEYTNTDVSYRKRKKRASIITTYSAKGGVGKTTIACNLATYIAMSSNGRRRNRVCIIDYNFDFGDVLNTLSFDSSSVTMIDWALDIKDRMDNGEAPEGITYNKADIEKFLQKNESTGLYALLAPVSHVDSLTIHGDELKVMINNILTYGDFDYVICDTGNNTRNSSMMSLEKADHIIMIATQDVTTVHDNRSFLDAIKTFNNVDENRVLLVINKAKSKKETLISCKEVEDNLNIPCVAHLREDSDVIKANNAGRPIVFNKNHEYTKQIGNIAARITGIGVYEPINQNAVTRVIDKVKDFFGF